MRNEVLENKKAVVAEIQGKINDAASMVVVEYRGLSVDQMTVLRRLLRAEDIELKIYKNSMLQRAVEGGEFEAMKEELVGPNAVAFGSDAVAPSRVLATFAKKNKALKIKTGIVDGKIVNSDELKELSSLPNHDGMIAMLLGMFQSPVRSFAYALSQVAEQKAAGGEVVEEVKTEEVVEETPVVETTEEPATEEVVEVAEESAE